MKVKLKARVESKIRANARRGARALDKAVPGWYKSGNLSLKRLTMSNACDCVYGQLNTTDSIRHNEAFQKLYGHEWGSGTPGYMPRYDPNDGRGCHVDRLAQNDWNTLHTLRPEVQEEVEAIQDEEWRVLQDEWESLIRIRRRAASAGYDKVTA